MEHYNLSKMAEEQRINADVEALQDFDGKRFPRITPTKSPDDRKKFVVKNVLSLDYKDRVNAASFYLDGGEHHGGTAMRGGYIYAAALFLAVMFGTGGFLIGTSSKTENPAPIRASYSSARGATVVPDESVNSNIVSETLPPKTARSLR
jgi:hypothetical protein